ncbi:amyloid-beta A4 precursor protein-binding family B member 3 isoform X2 [Varanus komodoensis]|uniref:amyloid-beta A4 precursor protein-binding family B member 3 isoform X2 n=1 Tax=Varanus komodoensis TaxID=61221 RepID=UPI001CF783A4|nr:amyloid-beta A4 precursor protein-binding family B member 3 isoform X2 [Varanus komodoensis]
MEEDPRLLGNLLLARALRQHPVAAPALHPKPGLWRASRFARNGPPGRCRNTRAAGETRPESDGVTTEECFIVRSLGWVEIPEEDLAPGKSSIAVNNCIQQLSQSKWGPAGRWGEGQDMVMMLKEDTMSLLDPLDYSLIHCQPIISIRVWGVGCNNGRDFAFVASDKDACMLKCHVFHCNVPAKAIAKALHEMCSKIMAERAVASGGLTRSVTLEPLVPEDMPQQADVLDAVRESLQKYDALFIGSVPVSKAMGMEVLNNAIEVLMSSRARDRWTPLVVTISDSVMQAGPAEVEDAHVWECQVRYITFIGIGKDARSFALISDMGQQRFQCTAFWCEPDAGAISEAVQAACMVRYQKCLVASASQARSKSSPRAALKMRRTMSTDSPGCPFPATGHCLQKSGSRPAARKRGLLAFLEAFRQKHPLLHAP